MFNDKFIVFLISIVVTSISHSYSCIEEIDVNNVFYKSDVAVIGRIDKKLFDLSFYKDKYLVSIEHIGKGEVGKKVILWTKSRCRANFSIEEKYVIFMKFKRNKLWTDTNMTWRIYEKTQPLTEKYLKITREELGSSMNNSNTSVPSAVRIGGGQVISRPFLQETLKK